MKVTTEITRRSLSCPSIHYALFMAPNELRHCCKRYFINGERKGDAVVFKVDSDDDINIDKINKNIRSIKIIKTAALDKSLIFFISVLNSSEILSDNFSIDVFSNSNANNKK